MATDLTLYSFPASTYGRAIHMQLLAKSLDFDYVKTRPHSEMAMKGHPLGKVPVLEHNGQRICESLAIACYIEALHPEKPMWPIDALDAARVDEWISLTNTVIDPLLVRRYLFAYIFPKNKEAGVDREVIDAALPEMERMLALIAGRMAPEGDDGVDGGLTGKTLTFADLNLYPILHYVRGRPEGAEMIARQPRITAFMDWMERQACVQDTAL